MSAPPMCINCAGCGWEPSVYRGRVPCSFCAPPVTARPTGVPLTADNVADAQECRDDDAVCVRVGPDAWAVGGIPGWLFTDRQMLIDVPRFGTVVTKWRK